MTEKVSGLELAKMAINLVRKQGKYSNPEAYQKLVEIVYRRSKVADHIAKRVKEQIGNTQDPLVLDLAAGTGEISRPLKKKHEVNVIATDFSAEMLRQLQAQAPDVTTVQLDFNQTLPFKDNSFHAVVTAHANRYIKNPASFVQQVYRILKPGGTFVWVLSSLDYFHWKRQAGTHQPTSGKKLQHLLKRTGFKEIELDPLSSLLTNKRFKGIPFYSRPRYLIAKKPL